MNYCNDKYPGTTKLSDIDIMVLKAYYGNIPTLDYFANPRRIEIPLVLKNGTTEKLIMTDSNRDGTYEDVISSTAASQSKAPGVYLDSDTLYLPLIKLLKDDRVWELWEATATDITDSNGKRTFKLESVKKLQPQNRQSEFVPILTE